MIRARSHGFFSAAGAALALLTSASPLLESFHQAEIRHVACPEDGELVDAPLQAAHQHADASGAGPELFAEGDPAAPRAFGQGHDHCAVAQAHLRGREQSRKTFAVTAPQAAAAPVPQDQPRLLVLALYRLAPKASPPPA